MREGTFTVQHKDYELKTDQKRNVNINVKIPSIIHEKGRCITVGTAGYEGSECVGVGGVVNICSAGSEVYDGVHSAGVGGVRGVHSAGSSVDDCGNGVMNRQESLILTPGLVDEGSPISLRCFSGDVDMVKCKQIPEPVSYTHLTLPTILRV